MMIAVVTEYLAKEGDPLFGGVDSRVVNLCQELAKRNEVHVFASLQSGEGGEERYGDIIVHRIGRPRPFSQRGHFLSRLEFSKNCAKEISRLNPDVIEASGFVSYPAGIYCKKLTSLPTMVTVHEVWQGEWSRNMGMINGAIGNLLERKNLWGTFDRYIAVSDFTKRKLVDRLGVVPDNVSVIHNGVDKELYDSVEIDAKFDSPTITTVCRLVSYKRVNVLIRAVKDLKAKWPDIKLKIVGRGPEEENLRQLVQSLGLERNVEFLGKYPLTKDLVKTLKRSHVYAHPSIVEGFGMVVVEAMAAGVPYVASDIPPINEATKGGVGGKLFPPAEMEQLVGQLDDTLEQHDADNDPRVPGLLEEYNWKNLAHQYEDVARDLVHHWDPDVAAGMPPFHDHG